MIKKKDFLLTVFLLIYTITVCTHVFFSDSKLNEILSTKFGFAHFFAFSSLFGFMIFMILISIMIIVLFKNSFHFENNIKNKFLVIGMLISVILIVGGTSSKTVEINTDGRNIRLVEWNIANKINESNIRDIFGEFNADIAVFPELGGYGKGDRSNKRLSDLFTKASIDLKNYEVFISVPTDGNIAPVTVIIKKEFGEYTTYKDTPITRFGTVYLSPKSNNNPCIIGVHSAPPLMGLMNIWKKDLELISNIAYNNDDSIIVGDFNATMRHGALNKIKTHIDALEYAPKFSTGTWHRSVPSIFRTTIDHILIPSNKYIVKSIETKEYNNSDHLCIFAIISEKK